MARADLRAATSVPSPGGSGNRRSSATTADHGVRAASQSSKSVASSSPRCTRLDAGARAATRGRRCGAPRENRRLALGRRNRSGPAV